MRSFFWRLTDGTIRFLIGAMKARRIVITAFGNREIKAHCGRCHRVETFSEWSFTAKGRSGVPWLLGENKDAAHYCSWRCHQRDLKLIRDPLPIPTPLTGSYEFALGFWACMKGY